MQENAGSVSLKKNVSSHWPEAIIALLINPYHKLKKKYQECRKLLGQLGRRPKAENVR